MSRKSVASPVRRSPRLNEPQLPPDPTNTDRNITIVLRCTANGEIVWRGPKVSPLEAAGITNSGHLPEMYELSFEPPDDLDAAGIPKSVIWSREHNDFVGCSDAAKRAKGGAR